MPYMVLVLVGVAVALGLLGVLAVTAALAQISDLPFPEAAAPRKPDSPATAAGRSSRAATVRR